MPRQAGNLESVVCNYPGLYTLPYSLHHLPSSPTNLIYHPSLFSIRKLQLPFSFPLSLSYPKKSLPIRAAGFCRRPIITHTARYLPWDPDYPPVPSFGATSTIVRLFARTPLQHHWSLAFGCVRPSWSRSRSRSSPVRVLVRLPVNPLALRRRTPSRYSLTGPVKRMVWSFLERWKQDEISTGNKTYIPYIARQPFTHRLSVSAS